FVLSRGVQKPLSLASEHKAAAGARFDTSPPGAIPPQRARRRLVGRATVRSGRHISSDATRSTPRARGVRAIRTRALTADTSRAPRQAPRVQAGRAARLGFSR